MRQTLLQFRQLFITTCDKFITKCDSYYKVRHLLQNASVQRTQFKFELID